jgi:hypothetical protein
MYIYICIFVFLLWDTLMMNTGVTVTCWWSIKWFSIFKRAFVGLSYNHKTLTIGYLSIPKLHRKLLQGYESTILISSVCMEVSFRMMRIEKNSDLFIWSMDWSGFVWRRMCVLSICQDLNIVAIRACGRASWERQPPSFGQTLLNGAVCSSMSIPKLFSLLWSTTMHVTKTMYYRHFSLC